MGMMGVRTMSFTNEYFRLNGGDAFTHQMDRARSRAGIRARKSGADVNAFLDSAGIKGRKTR